MTLRPFPVHQLPENVVRDDLEPLGTKRKFWYRNESGEKWLFKYGRPGTGEHWAEKIASDVARTLGLPCAVVELARHGQEWGTISRDFTEDGSLALVHGNELLGEQLAGYPRSRNYRVKEHTLAAIWGVLSNTAIEAPEGVPFDLPEPQAFALFAGYLLLDAVIGYTDRHHENWGVLLLGTTPRRMVLAPTFDHASSLGRELSDDKRRGRLAAKDEECGLVGYAEVARCGRRSIAQKGTSTRCRLVRRSWHVGPRLRMRWVNGSTTWPACRRISCAGGTECRRGSCLKPVRSSPGG